MEVLVGTECKWKLVVVESLGITVGRKANKEMEW